MLVHSWYGMTCMQLLRQQGRSRRHTCRCFAAHVRLDRFNEMKAVTTADLNHIDMAMKAYLPKLSESEQERLRFFRTLWGVQAEVQEEHAAKVEHVVPDASVLKECSKAEQPVLRAYPAGIPADALVDAAERLAGAMAVFEQFDQATRDALAGVRWDRLVAASDTKLAGSDPSAYVEAFRPFAR